MMEVVLTLKSHLLIRLRTCSLFVIFFCVSGLLCSQNTPVDKLKVEREQYLQEISNAKRLLIKKSKSRNEYLSQVTILNAQIGAQNNIIDTYKDEISEINSIISVNEKLVSQLSDEINQIKAGYEKLILEANKHLNSNYSEFMLIFSSSSFSEAYRRFHLIKQYSSYRKKQGFVLIRTQAEYDRIISLNQSILHQKQLSYNSLVKEMELLKLSVSQKQKYIDKLKNDESWLTEDIKKKKKFSDQLQLNIEKLISEVSNKSAVYGFSNFNSAKGKLIWPVNNGVVTSYFGEHNHAVLKGVKVKNNGVDITTSKENDVLSVYEGTVSRVIAIPGYNKAVIIRHGKYLTVYANLATVYVKSGQEIKSNQSIGQIFADSIDKNGILHFEIWEESKKINPLYWLRK